MHEMAQNSKIWRYDYNQSKSGVVVFGESRVQHYREKQARHWELDGNVVTELDEYKNLGVVKNYACSSTLDISEAIEKPVPQVLSRSSAVVKQIRLITSFY